MTIAKLALAVAVTSAMLVGVHTRPAVPAQAAQYRGILVREAHAAGGLAAPVPMFAAQLHQESGWKNTAKSGVGALGLAQFMPGTANWIAGLYPADLQPGAPYDPAWAIRALVRYDIWLYARVPRFQAGDERWAAALASYNGGLGWTLKDQKMAGGCDVSLWFGCVAGVTDKRLTANIVQNRDYPVRILLKIRPAYVAAGWN